MAALMASGTIADIVIAVMVLEGFLLFALRSRVGEVHGYEIFAMLAAGLFLVLALRATLTGAGWQWVAVFLAAAFVSHLLDLWRQIHQRQKLNLNWADANSDHAATSAIDFTLSDGKTFDRSPRHHTAPPA
jgi:hypothetical protein